MYTRRRWLRVFGYRRWSREIIVRTFDTTTGDLLALRDWLEANGVTHVAMESTGVYWKPIFYVLEDSFECPLVNATHIKQGGAGPR